MKGLLKKIILWIEYIDERCVLHIKEYIRNDYYYTGSLLRIINLLIVLMLYTNISLLLTIICSMKSIKYLKKLLLLLSISILIIYLKQNEIHIEYVIMLLFSYILLIKWYKMQNKSYTLKYIILFLVKVLTSRMLEIKKNIKLKLKLLNWFY